MAYTVDLRPSGLNAAGALAGTDVFAVDQGDATFFQFKLTWSAILTALDARYDATGAASAVLGTSLQKASNLSDLANAGTARTNLGLGSAAIQASSAFDTAGAAASAQSAAIAASCQRASNLSDVASAGLSRNNINKGAVALTDGATINTDAATGNVFTVTLGGNRTLANPTNLVAGATYMWVVTQDGTGSRTLAYGNKFKWPSGLAPTLTTAAASVDIITAYSDGTNLYASAVLDLR